MKSLLHFIGHLGGYFLLSGFQGMNDNGGFFSSGLFGSHSDLTRFAIPMANDSIYQRFGVRPYPTFSMGASLKNSSNPILLGNGYTDVPSEEIRQFYNAPKWVDWDDGDNLQSIHALRDYKSGYLDSTYETCEKIKVNIKNASKKALELWSAGDTYRAFYYLGTATHTIQDSFSPIHNKRDSINGKKMLQTCVYERNILGVCNHSDIADGDYAWHSIPICNFFSHPIRDYPCVKKEGKWAVLATAGYLQTMAGTFYEKGNLDKNLEGYFNDRSQSKSGFFDCRDAPKDTPKPRSDFKLPLISSSNGGKWGAWTLPVFCPEKTWVAGFDLRIESYQKNNDDTALNAIRLYCKDESGHFLTTVTPHPGFWGNWTNIVSADENSFFTGFKLRVEPPQGKGGGKKDDTAANSVLFIDQFGKGYTLNLSSKNPSGSWGSWGNQSSCPINTFVCGIQVRIETPQGSKKDDTALNDLLIACCSH